MAVHRQYQHVVIGNSAAAVATVEAIRKAGDTRAIALIGEEPYGVYARHLISYFITGDRNEDNMRFRPQNFYQLHGVTPMLGVQAQNIDWHQSTIQLSNGDTVKYGDLCLAVGARPIVPRLPGYNLRGVFTFTNLTQALALKGALPTVQTAVVVGGGLIGLQVAEALANVGKTVSVVELMPRLLAPVLDQTAADMVAERMRNSGISLHLGVGAQAILPSAQQPERVGGVELANGVVLPADVVVMAVGVAPRLELVQDSGMQVQRGILVDTFMESSLPNVYAAGDVAAATEFISGEPRPVPVWPNAIQQGRIAGLAMAGQKQAFTGSLMMNAAHFYGLPVVSAGLHDPTPEAGCTIITEGHNQHYYRKLVLRDQKVVGLVAVGEAVDKAGIIFGLIKSGVTINPLEAQRLVERGDLLALNTGMRQARLAGLQAV